MMFDFSMLVQSISKHYKLKIKKTDNIFQALYPITFTIRKGESWGILGANGSGKSTLLKILSGKLKPSTGQANITGNVLILDVSNGFDGHLTGIDNIFLKGKLHGLTNSEINLKLQSIVEFAEIGNFINYPVKTYSSGMVARLGFSIIAHLDPDILISDEALAVGDVFFVQKCMKYLRDFLTRGTFIFVSHSENDVVALCEHGLWLHQGKVEFIGTAIDAAKKYAQYTLKQSNTLVEVENQNQERVLKKNSIQVEHELISQYRDFMPIDFHRIVHDSMGLVHVNLSSPEILIDEQYVELLSAKFTDEFDRELKEFNTFQILSFKIVFRSIRDLHFPIIGFQCFTSCGQVLFGENSSSILERAQLIIPKGFEFETEFKFLIPELKEDYYQIRINLVIGYENEGKIVFSVDKYLVFTVESSVLMSGFVNL